MNSLCLFRLLAIISTIIFVGGNNVQIVDVTCVRKYNNPKTCTVQHVNYRAKTPSHLNILSDDATCDITYFKMTDGHYPMLPLNLFQLFPKLKILKISTGLEAITKENLSGGSKLSRLILRGNEITAIEAHIFDGMDKLKVINLKGNKLKKVESNVFAGATGLKKLVLSSNEIDAIEDGAFNVPTLEEVALSNNKLQTLTDDMFVVCPVLRIVSLDGNQLIRIGKSIDNVPKLTEVSFDYNDVKIMDLDFYAIARKPHLQQFFASGAGLVLDDTASAANGNYTVERLDISGNGLSYSDILHRLRNFRNLTWLNIGENNFATINDIEKILEMFPNLQFLYFDELPCISEIKQRLKSSLKHRGYIVDGTAVFSNRFQ